MKKTGDERGSLRSLRSRLATALLLLGLFLAPLHPLFPAESGISIEATVDSIQAGLLDTITLTVRVNTENIGKVLKPELPALQAFSVVNQGSSTQISTSMVNGKITRMKTFTYTYTLKPQKKGTLTIEPVSVTFEGVAYKTDPLTITITEGRAKAGAGGPGAGGAQTERQIDPEKLKNEIFILAKPESSEIFEGEQLFLAYTLYSRIEIDSISLRESPDFPGFYKEDVYNATRLEGKKESFNGKLYDTTLLKRMAVYPLKAGAYNAKPLMLEVAVVFKGDDLFSFFGKPYTFPVSSNEITVKVKPLPDNTTGRSFTQVVGEMNTSLSKRDNTVNTGEATTCYLIMKSTGNLNAMSDPGITLSKRGRVYLSDTISDRIEENGKLSMVKKLEYTIIPEENGTLEISSGETLFFDTVTKGYIVTKAQPVQIEVTGRNIYPDKPIISSKNEEGGGGLNYIKGDVKTLNNAPKELLQGLSYYLYHLVLAAATAVLAVIRVKKESIEKNEELFRKRKAKGAALDLLRRAGESLGRKEYTPAIDLTYQAVVTYIGDKSGKHPREVSIKNVDGIIAECFNVGENVRGDIINILEQSARLKFSKGGMERAAHAAGLYRKALSTIDLLELSLEENRKRRRSG